MLEFNKERDLEQLLVLAYEHDGQEYVDYIKEVIELPSNVLLVEYKDDELRAWVGFHNSEEGEYDHLYATSIDNIHTIDVWREIRKIVKGRVRPLVSGITDNFEKVNKLAQLYGGYLVGEHKVLVFP